MKDSLLRKITFLLSFAVLIICTGCPYQSDYPFAGSKVNYNKNLIGQWKSGESDLSITKKDEQVFEFTYNDHNPDLGSGKVSGKAYVVSNKDNLYIVGEIDDSKFITYKIIDISENNFKTIPFHEENMDEGKTFKSAEDFTKFVISKPSYFLMEDAQTYTRVNN